jgi:hypothetical protein
MELRPEEENLINEGGKVRKHTEPETITYWDWELAQCPYNLHGGITMFYRQQRNQEEELINEKCGVRNSSIFTKADVKLES